MGRLVIEAPQNVNLKLSVQSAVGLIRSYSNSHGSLSGDALIAAAALENDLTVVTYNADDFKFIADLRWLKPAV